MQPDEAGQVLCNDAQQIEFETWAIPPIKKYPQENGT
jgi:hypothetical protein